MKFEEAHEKFIQDHLNLRKGASLRRLEEGHDFAEILFLQKVWWPAINDFKYLHPEYQVSDFKDGNRYIDFAYIRSNMLLAIEIDGFGTHWQNISRWEFSDHCRRQNDLITDGWKILRFTYDDINNSPRYCQQKLQQFMGRWFGEDKNVIEATWVEKEAIRFALKLGRPVTPIELSKHLDVDIKTSRKLLYSLVSKKWMKPERGNQRIRSYRLNIEGKNYIL
ncbi:DNA-binding response regulator [Chengkuizengella sediminis]|uniref:DNA-binding response regulator n=1 Tax=Chengkuizengella sediminis TaxID=1885917 RepID=UPI001389B52F|nr:DNA-binding response regulator [Chengkuizengella sediminis]NDI34797.1 DNA-binding response regulator [Chengkuizengella sediminis]